MDTCAPRILVIDPHPITREGVVIVISASLAGSEVTGCANFQEALNVIDAVSADVVITDFRVQGDTALSLLKMLESRTPTPRCLILSASDEIQVGYSWVRAGVAGFVGKSSFVTHVMSAAPRRAA